MSARSSIVLGLALLVMAAAAPVRQSLLHEDTARDVLHSGSALVQLSTGSAQKRHAAEAACAAKAGGLAEKLADLEPQTQQLLHETEAFMGSIYGSQHDPLMQEHDYPWAESLGERKAKVLTANVALNLHGRPVRPLHTTAPLRMEAEPSGALVQKNAAPNVTAPFQLDNEAFYSPPENQSHLSDLHSHPSEPALHERLKDLEDDISDTTHAMAELEYVLFGKVAVKASLLSAQSADVQSWICSATGEVAELQCRLHNIREKFGAMPTRGDDIA